MLSSIPKQMTFEMVRKIGLALPDVEESTTFGATSLKARGKLLTCPALNKSAESGSIMVRVGFDQRQALLEDAPDIYYVTDHYASYPAVLVRLSRIDVAAMQGLLRMSWQFVTAKKPARKGNARRIP